MNRPEKRNALDNELRGAILAALQEADAEPDVKVSILRGAGPSFSAGYDLGATTPWTSPTTAREAPGSGRVTSWRAGSRSGTWRSPSSTRSTATAWPAGASSPRAATSVYVGRGREDRLPAHAARRARPTTSSPHGSSACARPWRCSTSDAITGAEAAAKGFANRAFPAAALDERCSASPSAWRWCPPSSGRSTRARPPRHVDHRGFARRSAPAPAPGARLHHGAEPGLPSRLQARRREHARAAQPARRARSRLPRGALAGPRASSLRRGGPEPHWSGAPGRRRRRLKAAGGDCERTRRAKLRRQTSVSPSRPVM